MSRRFRLDSEELLNIQMRAFTNSVPEVVMVGEKEKYLTSDEIEAAKLAIWYIFKRAWGRSSAVQAASGSFDSCNKSNVRRAVDTVFPSDYFKCLEISKNRHVVRDNEDEQV
jgi:hypothetical protein